MNETLSKIIEDANMSCPLCGNRKIKKTDAHCSDCALAKYRADERQKEFRRIKAFSGSWS